MSQTFIPYNLFRIRKGLSVISVYKVTAADDRNMKDLPNTVFKVIIKVIAINDIRVKWLP